MSGPPIRANAPVKHRTPEPGYPPASGCRERRENEYGRGHAARRLTSDPCRRIPSQRRCRAHWNPAGEGPCVVRVKDGEIDDISAAVPTMRDLGEADDRWRSAVREGRRVGTPRRFSEYAARPAKGGSPGDRAELFRRSRRRASPSSFRSRTRHGSRRGRGVSAEPPREIRDHRGDRESGRLRAGEALRRF